MAQDPEVTAFGGVTARVLREALSFGTLLTGFVLVAGLALIAWWLKQFHAGQAAPPIIQAILAVVLAKFAGQGRYGEWKGSMFSSRGGDWWDAWKVALRYGMLSALWVTPLMLLVLKPDDPVSAVSGLMFGGGSQAVSVFAIYIAALMLTPPISLIMSVGVEKFEHLFSLKYWHEMFHGRGADLFLIYSAYLGGIFMVCLMALPFIVAIAVQKPEAGLIFGGIAVAFGIGYSITLMGRLCGFFAGSAPVEESAAPQFVPPHRPVPVRGGAGASSTPGDGMGLASGRMADTMMPAVAPRMPSGKGPLLEARKRVDEILNRAGQDPAGAITALEELRVNYAPNPLVLHALSMTHLSMDNRTEALELAREAFPVLLERGNLHQAAEIHRAFMDEADPFSMSLDHLVAVAGALKEMGDVPTAVETYFRLLRRDSLDQRGIKKSLQIAEEQLHREPAEALRIYAFLIEHASTSPLADYMREGAKEAERRIALRNQKIA